MKKLFGALLLLSTAVPVMAQVTVDPSGNVKPAPPCVVQADGATCVPVSLNNPLPVNVINGGGGGGGSVPTGTAGSPNANVVTVQGIAGATPLPITYSAGNLALDTTVNSLFKAGQSIGNTGFASIGSAGTAYQQGTGASGANAQNVYIGGQFGPVATQQLDTYTAPASYSAAANTIVPITIGSGQGTAAITISGLTASGATLTASVSDNKGASFNPARYMGTATVPGATTITTDGIYSFALAGHTNLQLQVTTGGTGTFTATSNLSAQIREINLGGVGTASTNPLFATVTGTVTIANPTSSALTGGATYIAVTAGTGYAVGDFLDHVVLADPTSGSVTKNYWIDTTTNTTLASAPTLANLIPLYATGQAQAAANTSLATIAATTGTVGSAAPSTAAEVAGVGPNGNLRSLATGTNGGLLSSQFVSLDSSPVTVTGGATAVQIDTDVQGAGTTTAMTTAQRAARSLFTIQLETANTAPVFLCYGGQTTSCNATFHTGVIPVSSTAYATVWTSPGGYAAPVYVFSSAAVTVKISSQVAQ